ncbi:hypothetical protein V6N13_068707 [Hibiscus sabdariffa]
MKCQAALVCPKLELSSDGRELSTLMKGYALSLKKLLKKKKLLEVLVTTRKVVLLNTNLTQAELLRKTLMNIKLEVTTNFSEKYNPAKLLIASTQPWGGGGLAGGATKDDAEELLKATIELRTEFRQTIKSKNEARHKQVLRWDDEYWGFCTREDELMFQIGTFYEVSKAEKVVTEVDIQDIVSSWTGIPVEKVNTCKIKFY